jgi:hypothetical protein
MTHDSANHGIRVPRHPHPRVLFFVGHSAEVSSRRPQHPIAGKCLPLRQGYRVPSAPGGQNAGKYLPLRQGCRVPGAPGGQNAGKCLPLRQGYRVPSAPGGQNAGKCLPLRQGYRVPGAPGGQNAGKCLPLRQGCRVPGEWGRPHPVGRGACRETVHTMACFMDAGPVGGWLNGVLISGARMRPGAPIGRGARRSGGPPRGEPAAAAAVPGGQGKPCCAIAVWGETASPTSKQAACPCFGQWPKRGPRPVALRARNTGGDQAWGVASTSRIASSGPRELGLDLVWPLLGRTARRWRHSAQPVPG